VEICHSAAISVAFAQDSLHVSNFVRQVEKEFCQLFLSIVKHSKTTAAQVHRENLDCFLETLQEIKDLNISLACLLQVPEYCLPCGHAVCCISVQIYANNAGDDPWRFRLDKCIVCQSAFSEPVLIKFHNPVRGLHVLSLDSGGCWEIVFLKFLQILQSRIGLLYPVQEHFDIAIGTSSGKSTALAIFQC
jgi:hypothetical protein